MKLSGWQRLWVLLSVIYVFPVAFFTLNEFTSANRTLHNTEFYNKLPKHSLSQLVIKSKSQSFIDPDEIGTEVEMPNGHQLSFRKGVNESDMSIVAEQYNDIVAAEVSTKRLMFVGVAIVVWLVPCLAAYALGWGVGWVYRGFRRGT